MARLIKFIRKLNALLFMALSFFKTHFLVILRSQNENYGYLTKKQALKDQTVRIVFYTSLASYTPNQLTLFWMLFSKKLKSICIFLEVPLEKINLALTNSGLFILLTFTWGKVFKLLFSNCVMITNCYYNYGCSHGPPCLPEKC